jgi:drug/metabolite transporter (DMT)-like permease
MFSQATMNRFPALRGASLALLAAVLFGASTPLIQKMGEGISPWMTACLLYAGAALIGLFSRVGVKREAAIRVDQLPRLLIMAILGAVIGPVLLAWGLHNANGASASLLLTLEAVFTVMLAYVFYREQIDKRVGIAITLMTLGGAVLVGESSSGGVSQMLGLLAVLGATISWALDNSLSRGFADVDPSQVVLAKSAIGTSCTLLISIMFDQMGTPVSAAISLILIGAIGYGLSLRFYLLAQRSFGAARTGSVFASAPFIGVLAAVALGDRSFSLWMGLAAALMLSGVIIHLLEIHEHEHIHESMEHEHAHTHDDEHHFHLHEHMPVVPHSHRHRHDAISHQHPHAPDLHHTHIH